MVLGSWRWRACSSRHWRRRSAALVCQSLLRAQLGQRVNVMILEKALTLELRHFEDSEFYDKLTRARREASSRPLSLVMRTLRARAERHLRSPATARCWCVLAVGGARAVARRRCRRSSPRAKFSGDAFRLFRWRSPETRMQMYLETVLAREDHAKEVKLFGLGPLLLERYRDDLPQAVRRGPRADAPPRRLGLRARAAQHGRVLRRLRVDRARAVARPDHARRR